MTLGQVFSASLFASLFTLFVAMPCHATVSNVAVSGASAYDNTTTPATPVIFGGNTGAIGDCAGSPATLCNACTALTNVCDTSAGVISHCAENSITPNVLLTVQITVDQIPTSPTIVMRVGTTNVPLANSPIIAANTPMTVQARWGDICAAIGGAQNGGFDSNCTTGGPGYSGTLTVGIADSSGNPVAAASQAFTLKVSFEPGHTANPTLVPDPSSSFNALGVTPFLNGCTDIGAPFCSFSIGNGDSKVYINDLKSNTNQTGDGVLKWNNARLYFIPYAEGTVAGTGSHGFCDVNLATASHADLFVTNKSVSPQAGGYGVSTTKISSGLSNDQTYLFLLATQDEASIVTGFMDSGEFTKVPACASGLNDGTCSFIGHPGQVIGLLDDQKCFIATAAWGSAMEPHVMLLRQFRNQFLLTNPLGTWFVHTYYRLSPPLAHWIAQHETARTVARTMLWPLVWMADAMIDHTKTYFSTPLYMAPSAPAKAAK